MTDYTFFFHPMSRAQTARWAFQEVGAQYDGALVDMANKPKALLDANPMGKIPTIIHHSKTGDHVVSETAAISHYIAEAENSPLLPKPEEKADYFRWMFFASGPVEAAVTARAMGWEPMDAQQEGTVGFGSFDRVMDTLHTWLSSNDYACGSRFTMADVILGAQIDWGLQFGTIPARDSFAAYAERLRARDAYKDAKGIDLALIEAAGQG